MESSLWIEMDQTCPPAIGSQMTSKVLNWTVGEESFAVLMKSTGIIVHLVLFSIIAAISLILYAVRLFFFKEQRDEDAPSFLDILFFR